MAIASQEGAPSEARSVDLERKPLLSFKAILLMNFGFFGIQYSFGLQQTAINPIYAFLGADPASLPLLNLAGPITGLVIQPLIGAMSDRTWSDRYGRRKPYFIIGALGCMICLFLYPFVFALWMAVLLLWLLDASNNTAMEPYRAFIGDKLPKSQLARGFLTQSLFVGAGAVTANFSLVIFSRLIEGTTAAGIPFWVFWAFFIGAACSIGTVLISVLTTKEIPPTPEELAELRASPGGLTVYVKEIADTVRTMPNGLHKIGVVYLFQWYAIVVYWQFVSVSIGETTFNAVPGEEGFEAAAGWVGAMNGTYNVVTMIASLALIGIAAKLGAKYIHAIALGGAAIAMFAVTQIGDQYLLLVPMVLLGIAWASMMGIPYIIIVSLVPQDRLGVHMGVVNMMIVVPMLIQTFTFGWIFENLLGSSGSNALIFSGVLFAIGAVAMLFVGSPSEVEESPIMPIGSPREISIYDCVVVGSDGTENSLKTVGQAAGVAAAADARLVVVTAYSPETKRSVTYTEDNENVHRDLYGEEAARSALDASVRQLKQSRIKNIEQRIILGSPAKALLEVAGDNRSNLIVVGNRGLGAADGQLLGSVPSEVASNAVCDVMIVQTSEEATPPVDVTTTT